MLVQKILALFYYLGQHKLSGTKQIIRDNTNYPGHVKIFNHVKNNYEKIFIKYLLKTLLSIIIIKLIFFVLIKIVETAVEYKHDTVNHSQNFISPLNSNVRTQCIEALWIVLKRWLRLNYLSRRDHIELYLSEFIFRQNNKTLSKKEIFEKIVSLLMNSE